MCLNLIGVAYYGGLWFDGNGWRSLYHILQASRVVVLWNVLHQLGSTSSGETTRLTVRGGTLNFNIQTSVEPEERGELAESTYVNTSCWRG